MVYIPDANTVVANLLAESVDIATTSSLPFNQGLLVKRELDSRGGIGTILIESTDARATEFQMHPERVAPGLRGTLDLRVRRAMAYTVNKPASMTQCSKDSALCPALMRFVAGHLVERCGLEARVPQQDKAHPYRHLGPVTEQPIHDSGHFTLGGDRHPHRLFGDRAFSRISTPHCRSTTSWCA